MVIPKKNHDCVMFMQCFFSFTVDFVLDQKNVPLLEAYDKWRNWADGKVCCDYALHSCVTWWSPEVAKEMEILCKEKGQFHSFIIHICINQNTVISPVIIREI